MKHLIATTGIVLLASAAMAQTPATAPVAGAVDAVTGAVTPPTPAEAAANAKRNEEAQKAAEREQQASEERVKDQERQAEKEREASEKRMKEQEKLAATQAAEAEKAAAAAAAAAPAAAMSGDAREVATQVCLADAKQRAMTLGAKNVTMREVEDTDKKSDGRASVRASVNIVTLSSSGKVKTQKKTFKCDTRNGTVTKFKWS